MKAILIYKHQTETEYMSYDPVTDTLLRYRIKHGILQSMPTYYTSSPEILGNFRSKNHKEGLLDFYGTDWELTCYSSLRKPLNYEILANT